MESEQNLLSSKVFTVSTVKAKLSAAMVLFPAFLGLCLMSRYRDRARFAILVLEELDERRHKEMGCSAG